MEFYSDKVNIFGLEVKYYGILMAAAFIVGLIFAIVFTKKKGYKKSLPFDLLLIVFPSAIIGARLCYVLFNWGDGWTFVEILQIWNGGLMIYGGVGFAVISIAIYCAIKKIKLVSILDMLAPCLILGQAIGRWGNYFNQEAYGALIVDPKYQWFPFGVFIERSHFTQEATNQVVKAFGSVSVDGAWFNATFFYESMWCLIGFILLYFIFTKTKRLGLTTATYFVFYGVERLLVELIRTDSLYIGTVKVSVLISIALVASGLVWLTILAIKKPNSKKASGGLSGAVEVSSGQSLSLEDLEDLDDINKIHQSAIEPKDKIEKQDKLDLVNLYKKLEAKSESNLISEKQTDENPEQVANNINEIRLKNWIDEYKNNSTNEIDKKLDENKNVEQTQQPTNKIFAIKTEIAAAEKFLKEEEKQIDKIQENIEQQIDENTSQKTEQQDKKSRVEELKSNQIWSEDMLKNLLEELRNEKQDNLKNKNDDTTTDNNK